MDSNYVLSCCSTADLTAEHFKNIDVEYVCFHFDIDEKEYFDDLGNSIPFSEFYAAMRNGANTKTSQVNPSEYAAFFEPFLKQGKDILHICLSSGLSGTINSANIAKEALLLRYPERKIYVVDSLAASSGYGLIMDALSEMRQKGSDIDEAYDWIEKHKLELQHWFFSTDLTFYVKGGRLSKTGGFIGGILDICPILNVDAEGKPVIKMKIRTKKQAIREAVNIMEQNALGGLAYNDKCFVTHSDCYEDAQKVADLIEKKFQYLKGNVEIDNIGPTIGSHTGPGTVGLCFWGHTRAVQ